MSRFLSQVQALRSALDISINLPMRAAVAEMSNMMGLPAEDPHGVPIALPVQVEALLQAVGLNMEEQQRAGSDDDSDVKMLTAPDSSTGAGPSGSNASASGASGQGSCTSTSNVPKKQRTCSSVETQIETIENQSMRAPTVLLCRVRYTWLVLRAWIAAEIREGQPRQYVYDGRATYIHHRCTTCAASEVCLWEDFHS